MAKKKNKSAGKALAKSPFLITLTIISAVFTCVCFGFFLAASLSQSAGAFSYFVGGTAVAVCVLTLFTLIKQPRWLTYILCIGLTFFTLSCSAFMAVVAVSPQSALPEGKCVVIVFGAHTNGLMPGRSLTTRLLTAYEYLSENPDAICIVSGGQGENETESEAAAMRHVLISRGIDGSRIIMEDSSSDTVENLENSAAVIKREGLEGLPIVFVSNKYHVARVSFLARRVIGDVYSNAELYTAGAKTPSVYYFFSDYTREYMAWIKLGIRVASGELTAAGA